jgi:hypothetical protein
MSSDGLERAVSDIHKVLIYLEYHSVCPVSPRLNWGPPSPLPQPSVPPNQRGGGIHTCLCVREWGSPRWTVCWPASSWPPCTVYSVTSDYWTTWCPDELHAAQPLLDPLVQCTLLPRITELPDVQMNGTPPSLSLTHLYSVLCYPGLLNYLMSRWIARRPASHVLCDPGFLNYLKSRWTARRPASPSKVYSVTPDYWTTWCPDELHAAQPLFLQCTLWPRIT